jgi:hypothetical protein
VNTFLLGAFLVLMFVEGAGTLTFLALYLRGDWRSTAVGRHLAYYSTALAFLYATGIISVFVPAMWLFLVILAGHMVFAAVIWQRVWLVWQAHRRRT